MKTDVVRKLDFATRKGIVGKSEPVSFSTQYIRNVSGKYDSATAGRIPGMLFSNDGVFFAWSLLWLAFRDSGALNEQLMQSSVIGLAKVNAVNNKMTFNLVDHHIQKTTGKKNPGIRVAGMLIGLNLDDFLGDMALKRVEYLDGAVQRCLAGQARHGIEFCRPLLHAIIGRTPGEPPKTPSDLSDERLDAILYPIFEKHYPTARNNIDAQVRRKANELFQALFEANHGEPIVISIRDCGAFMVSRLLSMSGSDKACEAAELLAYKHSPFFGTERKQIRLVSEYLMMHVALMIHAANLAYTEAEAKLVIDEMLDILGGRVFAEFEKLHAGFKMQYSIRMNEYFSVLKQGGSSQSVAKVFAGALGIDTLSNEAHVLSMAGPIENFLGSAARGLGQVTIADSLI